MTLNQLIKRIRNISLAHKQVRTFARGMNMSEMLNDKQTKYPAVFLLDNGGSISLTGNASTFNFRMLFIDLVHVSDETKDNEQDVQSDMISVAQDVLAQMSHPGYDDWRLEGGNNLQLLAEEYADMAAGCRIDISINVIYDQNVCAVPTTLATYSAIPARARITLFQDLTTGQIELRLREIPAEGDPLAENKIEVTDELILTDPNNGSKSKITAYKNPDTGEIELIFTSI